MTGGMIRLYTLNGNDYFGNMVFYFRNINRRNNVLFGDWTVDDLALLFDPFNSFYMGLYDIFVFADMNGCRS